MPGLAWACSEQGYSLGQLHRLGALEEVARIWKPGPGPTGARGLRTCSPRSSGSVSRQITTDGHEQEKCILEAKRLKESRVHPSAVSVKGRILPPLPKPAW
ncbi:hypothetical protein APTSU1_000449800 [Apodemus speciosus]|uniref:Uncharacterized protein n=1 Tax=Apodemus speciosus TaxID=105296 RepID=A0ABQ0EQV5_APOSI